MSRNSLGLGEAMWGFRGMNGGGFDGSSTCTCGTLSVSGGGGRGFSGDVAPLRGRLEDLSVEPAAGRAGERAEAGDMLLDKDSGTSKPYRWRGGCGLSVRDDGPPSPKTFRLVLRAWPRCSSDIRVCGLADDTLLDGGCDTDAMFSAAPPTSPASGSSEDIGNKPIFCWCMTSRSAYECASAAHENVSRRTEVRHPPYSMALMALGGEFSDICTSRSRFLSPMTTTTPSSPLSSSPSFRSTPPTQRHAMGLKLDSGLSSGRE